MKFIGEVYKEKVLSLPPKERKKVEIPLNDGVTRIEAELFGWKIYFRKLGRKQELFIDCRSEEEARYIKIFIDMYAQEVYVPNDDNLLKEVLEEIEDLKIESDKILNVFLRTIRKRSNREKLKFMVYKDLLKGYIDKTPTKKSRKR